MHTGIKHLLGLSATLLLLLTLIAWVDSHENTRGIRALGGEWDAWMSSSNFGLAIIAEHHRTADFRKRAEIFSYPNRPTAGTLDWELTQDHEFVAFGFAVSLHYQAGARMGVAHTGVILPHWFATTILVVPSFIYVHFLYRRYRSPSPIPHRSDN